ncbi:hypothetical protein IMY05_C2487000600 [Salix suchowensis]|nr:hypothetical protein IMY05_C2487000600 [Salix suchowensis]
MSMTDFKSPFVGRRRRQQTVSVKGCSKGRNIPPLQGARRVVQQLYRQPPLTMRVAILVLAFAAVFVLASPDADKKKKKAKAAPAPAEPALRRTLLPLLMPLQPKSVETSDGAKVLTRSQKRISTQTARPLPIRDQSDSPRVGYSAVSLECPQRAYVRRASTRFERRVHRAELRWWNLDFKFDTKVASDLGFHEVNSLLAPMHSHGERPLRTSGMPTFSNTHTVLVFIDSSLRR